MLKFFQRAKASPAYGTPLLLRATTGSLSQTFDASIVNSFRHMATNLDFNGGLPGCIAFIAALSGEGVTYTSLAFGTTLATDTTARVCVVELNWWSPGMLAQLSQQGALQAKDRGGRRRKQAQPSSGRTDIPAGPGLAQVLGGTATLDEAIITTEQPNLHLLPAGELPIASRPLMARSKALRELIGQLQQRYDHLILDIPAILTTSDAIALTALSDACVLVVRQGVTPTPSVKRALDDVRNEKVLGVVLNQVQLKTPQFIHTLIPQE